MARYIYINFLMFFAFIAPAFAGFEWVPPAKNPAPRIAPQHIDRAPMATDRLPAVPAPSVSPLPLHTPAQSGLALMALENNRAVSAPVASLSRQSYSSAQGESATKNLSGKKLVINPYPLRTGNGAPEQASISQAYKALSEGSGLLNPVRLGNGLSTGVKKRSISHPVPEASRMVSAATAPRSPSSIGLTPMIGGEPAPLVRGNVQQVPLQNNYAKAIGFGRDLPLALALSQIIPSDYTHNFSTEVDAGISVSWEGGKSWDQVLDDMLKPKNLMAVIRDKRVIIQPLAHI